jgi:Na+-translocating ferredoxin:NAD+ oxidoreductase RnfC subunit
MTAEPIIIRVDATERPKLQTGDRVRQGQRLGSQSERDAVISPVTGTVRNVRFDPRAHEFLITVIPQG